MQLGIGSYSYTWAVGVPGSPPARPLTPLGLLDRAAQLGVRVVQFADNLSLARLEPRALDAVLARAQELGLRLELGARGLTTDLLAAHLGLATRCGADFVRWVVDAPGDEPAPAEIVRRVRPCAGLFRDAGVRLAFENHDRFPARTLAGLVEELGPDWTGICLDTVNSFGALEGPDVVIAELARYTVNLHLKDFTIRRLRSQMGFVVEGCPAGTGRLNIPAVLARLREAGRDVNAILELWTPPAEDLEATLAREAEWAAQSIRQLRAWIPD